MHVSESAREIAARTRADERLRRQRDVLRPLGLVVIAAVVVGAINGRPTPSLHGTGLALGAALLVFSVALALAVRRDFIAQRAATQATVILAISAGAVAVVALQPRGTTDLAGGAAVWIALTRLPLILALALAASVTVGLDLAEALTGGSATAILAATLLCALLGLAAFFIKQARASQDTTELLLAQLEDAREEQLRAAALTERGRIASELHDVLAHSLSGAAIQLQGARKLAERAQAGSDVQAAIDRAADLVREGLANARRAVGALRGDELPGVTDLEPLVTAFRDDTNSDVTFATEGTPRALPADASLALYRGAQEALTNVARYASGATTTVLLAYRDGRTTLTVEDRIAEQAQDSSQLAGLGGGNGLAGLRERLERLGGTLRVGPTETGWRVDLEVPA
jgi:signal transduction histidine kinase